MHFRLDDPIEYVVRTDGGTLSTLEYVMCVCVCVCLCLCVCLCVCVCVCVCVCHTLTRHGEDHSLLVGLKGFREVHARFGGVLPTGGDDIYDSGGAAGTGGDHAHKTGERSEDWSGAESKRRADHENKAHKSEHLAGLQKECGRSSIESTCCKLRCTSEIQEPPQTFQRSPAANNPPYSGKGGGLSNRSWNAAVVYTFGKGFADLEIDLWLHWLDLWSDLEPWIGTSLSCPRAVSGVMRLEWLE
jgi:hypothetical protein